MRGHINKLSITVGLPGSGKTKWAESEAKRDRNVYHLECDNYLRRHYNSMRELLINYSGTLRSYTILDGLFLSLDNVSEAVEIIISKKFDIKAVEIVRWGVDRESCIWNDLYRRGVDSGITISNGVVDEFDDISSLKEKFPKIKFTVVNKKVVRKEPFQVFASKYELHTDEHGKYKGDSWCTGGTWQDCWGGGGNVGADSPPDGMSVLDELLEKISPNITFLQYRNLQSQCVYTEEYSDGDYYGGTTYHNQYVLDVKKLYEYLVEKEITNIIKIIE